jgi:peroxiredoxin Q/BCP
MSHRAEVKKVHREERRQAEEAARRAESRHRVARRAGYGAVGLIAVTLVALAVLLPGASKPTAPEAAAGAASGAEVGDTAPNFALTDVISGRQVTAASLRGSKTLLFFSEGVNCQACMIQAADLENARALDEQGIELVSVTADQPRDLANAAKQYGISTPLLSDPTTGMSSAYGMLGHGGMGHPDTNGHAFILLDENGTIRWHRAYQEMYVKPDTLVRDMSAEMSS